MAGSKDKPSSTQGGSGEEYSALDNSKVRPMLMSVSIVISYHPCRRVVGNQQNLHLLKHVKRRVSTTFHWTMGRETEVDVRTSHPVPRREVEKNTVLLTKIRYRMQISIN